ncbi:MAG: DUF445 family protein [Kiritimatiellae bacterium]|nr:DUF445 family protein [Kiritimatiellia bacterium]
MSLEEEQGSREKPISGFGLRWATLRDPEKGMATRLFALAEIVLLPLSFLTFLYVIAEAVTSLFGIHLADYFSESFARWILPVLTAAAIGYVTNWLAILMLFRPYEPHNWFFLWPQGLLPRNKAKMAKEIGKKVGTELLPPDTLVAEFETEAHRFLARPDVAIKCRDMLQEMLHTHEADIVRLIVPQIEKSMSEILESLVTPEQIQVFWNETLAPRLNDPETRDWIAKKIVEAINDNAPELVQGIREKLRAYLSRKLPFPDLVINFVMDFFADPNTIQTMISDWLREEDTLNRFREKLLLVGEKISEWIHSKEGERKIEKFTGELKEKARTYIASYLKSALPKLVGEAVSSEKLWAWVEGTALPKVKSRLLEYLAENKSILVEKLRLDQRVEDAINAQKIEHFHQMLNDLAAQHLSAIQVLGYVLGALVGFIQLHR